MRGGAGEQAGALAEGCLLQPAALRRKHTHLEGQVAGRHAAHVQPGLAVPGARELVVDERGPAKARGQAGHRQPGLGAA